MGFNEISTNTSVDDKIGWAIIAEKSMKKIWDNDQDDKIWEMYL